MQKGILVYKKLSEVYLSYKS